MIVRKRESGFTLIELLIVASFLGILAVICAIQFHSYRIRSFNSAAVSDISSFRSSMETFFAEHNYYP